MPAISIEQALYSRPAGEPPQLRATSPGFTDACHEAVKQLLLDYGDRPTGIPCPGAIFAQPLAKDQVAIVQVGDQPTSAGQPPLRFHVLVAPSAVYRQFHADPFALADQYPPPWQYSGTELPALTLATDTQPPRTVADVQRVLKRVKAGALREDEDPETVELTAENAESPALLGGVQILVDGGKLVFVRSAPDDSLIRGLWTLLPSAARAELWPATFAFSNALGFDALVVPRPGIDDFAGYSTEEQAAEYPPGHYELSVQTAAETGDQAALDALFGRRSSNQTLRLAIHIAIALSIMVLVMRFFFVPPSESPEQRVARIEKAMSAAGVVSSYDPFVAAVQARLGHARYMEKWKMPPAKE